MISPIGDEKFAGNRVPDSLNRPALMLLQTAVNRCSDGLFSAKRKILGRHRVRRGRLYCVSIGKSGTHSIANMFSRTVRSAHEVQAVPLMEKILAWRETRISEREFGEWLHRRDRELALEVDSSTLNFEILDILLREFPDARFVLTIRDCYSWCDSFMNHAVRNRQSVDPLWHQMGRFRGNRAQHAPEEQLLKENGFLSLDSYFSYWTKHNQTVLDKVPAQRLLVVRTDQIQERAFEIADFAGLPRRSIRMDRAHEYRNLEKQEILRQIDRDFLEALVEKHCRPLMKRFFPEIESLDDARL
jgi:hypothetical protein